MSSPNWKSAGSLPDLDLTLLVDPSAWQRIIFGQISGYIGRLPILHRPEIIVNRNDNRLAIWEPTKVNTIFEDITSICYDGVRTYFSLNLLKMPNDGPTADLKVSVRLPRPRENSSSIITAHIAYVSEVRIEMRQVRVASLHGEQYGTPLQFLDVVCRQARSLYPCGSEACGMDGVRSDAWYPFASFTYMMPGYHGPQPPLNLGGGCELWHGHERSRRPRISMCNIDVANGAFYCNGKLPVIQLLVDILNDAAKCKDQAN